MAYLVNSLRGKINFRKKFKHCLTLEEDLWSGFHHLWSKCYLSKLKADNRYQNNRHRIQRVPGEEITYRCNWAYSWNDTIKAGGWLTLILHQNRSPTKFFVLFTSDTLIDSSGCMICFLRDFPYEDFAHGSFNSSIQIPWRLTENQTISDVECFTSMGWCI